MSQEEKEATQEDAFIDSGKREFKGQPAVLTKIDYITLQAMGLDLFQLEQITPTYPGVLRDAVLAVWLAVQNSEGKKKAARNPKAAIDAAFDWLELTNGGTHEGLSGIFGLLLKDIIAATLKPDNTSSSEDSGELPP